MKVVDEKRLNVYFAKETAVETSVLKVDRGREVKSYIVLRGFSHANYDREKQIRFMMDPVEATEIGLRLTEIYDYIKGLSKQIKKQEDQTEKNYRKTITLGYHSVEVDEEATQDTKLSVQVWVKNGRVGSALVMTRTIPDSEKPIEINVPMRPAQLYHLGKVLENLGTSPEVLQVVRKSMKNEMKLNEEQKAGPNEEKQQETKEVLADPEKAPASPEPGDPSQQEGYAQSESKDKETASDLEANDLDLEDLDFDFEFAEDMEGKQTFSQTKRTSPAGMGKRTVKS